MIKENPFPVTYEKMVAFLVYQKNCGRKCSTLLNYINGFSYYFRENGLNVLTQSIKFKVFKSGLRRTMMAGSYPNAKLPFNPEWFPKIIDKFPISTTDNLRFIFFISLMYAAFLRIDEALNIRKSDIIIESPTMMKLVIKSSKTDQFGHGTFTYLYDNGSSHSPFRFINYLEKLDNDQKIQTRSLATLRAHLCHVLKQIGVEGYENYGFHSFRRGGAYHASLNGVNDCIIKAHGRWKSSAYIRYVAVDMSRAGMEVSQALS